MESLNENIDLDILDSLFYDTFDAENPSDLSHHYKEFLNEVTPERTNILPPGFFFPYQEQNRRLMRTLDRLLVLSEPGTGKTFDAVSTAEMLRGNYDPSLPPDLRLKVLPSAVRQYLMPERRNITHVYYLTANPILINQAKKVVPFVKGQLGLSKDDNKFYTITTYGTFLTKTTKIYKDNKDKVAQGLMTEEEMEESMRLSFKNDYSDSYFILDEVHKLGGEDVEAIAKGKDIYKLYHMLFHSIERSIVEAYSATIINNSTKEVLPVANLLLPSDQQISWDTNFDKMSDYELEETLKSYFANKVAYIRANPAGTNPVYHGIQVPYSPFKYYPCVMIGKQLQQYIKVSEGELTMQGTISQGEEENEVDKARDTLHANEGIVGLSWIPTAIKKTKKRQYVIVDPIYLPANSEVVKNIQEQHEAAVRAIMEKTTTKKPELYEGKVRKYVDVPTYLFDTKRMASHGEIPEMWTLEGGLRERSAKYYEAIQMINNSPKTVNLMIERYIANSGIAALTSILLLNGYERYSDTFNSYASGEHINGLTKKKRVMVLEPSMKASTLSMFLDLIGHPDNKNGEYVEIVIISPGMKIGISIYNVRRIFHFQPEWTPAGELQGLSRGLREGGLRAYIQELAELGISILVNIEIYLMCAVIPDDVRRELTEEMKKNPDRFNLPRKFLTDAGVIREEYTTLDEDQYELLGLKYRDHKRVSDILYGLSSTCHLNVKRNGISFPCIDLQSPDYGGEDLYTKVFNVLYSSRYVYAIKQYIKQLMKHALVPVHISDVMNDTRNYNFPIYTYYRAIYELIDDKVPFITNIGNMLYLNFDREYLYLQRDYPVGNHNNFLMHYYSRYLPITYSQIEEIIPEISDKEASDVLSANTSDELRSKIIKDYSSVGKQIGILEMALMSIIDLDDWKKSKWRVVLEVYRNYWAKLRGTVANAILAHSFISFWREAGYPIIARLKVPSRYRYFVSSGNVREWRTTGDRDYLVEEFYEIYYKDNITRTMNKISPGYPMAYDTICDNIYRVSLGVLSEEELGTPLRGKNIASYTFMEILYILFKIDPHALPLVPAPINPALDFKTTISIDLKDISITEEDITKFSSFYMVWRLTTDRKYIERMIKSKLKQKNRVVVV